MNKNQKGIDEKELRRALTGGSQAFIEGRINAYAFLNGKVSIDTTIEAEMDRAYILTKKFEREYRTSGGNPQHFRTEHDLLDRAYLKGDPTEFKSALEWLLYAIRND